MGLGPLIFNPYLTLVNGRLTPDLEIVYEGGRIIEIRKSTAEREPYILSVPFVNAHSHLEYRAMQGKIEASDFASWLRNLTQLKQTETQDEVVEACELAARENYQTGVGLIGEHSDRPFSGAALEKYRITGKIYQEVITLFEHETPGEKLDLIHKRMNQQAQTFSGEIYPNPHAIYTNVPWVLDQFGASKNPISLHLAESLYESQLTQHFEGPFGEFYRAHSVPYQKSGKHVFWTAVDHGLVRERSQLVHVCDVGVEEIAQIASSGATIAHNPRSNMTLGCPIAPVREMLDAQIYVGLGMDSAASSGSINYFEEMRSALSVSRSRRKPLTGDEILRMATSNGAKSLHHLSAWDMTETYKGSLIKINLASIASSEELVEIGQPEHISWIHPAEARL